MQYPLLKAIIVDDEPKAIAKLKKLLERHSTLEVVSTISDSSTAVETILRIKPDLLFMDIQMPGMNGFEIVEELFLHQFKPDFIFTTAYDNFAIEAVRHSAFDFLVKPIDPDELKNAITRLLIKKQEISSEQDIKQLLERTVYQKKLKIPTTSGFSLIRPDDILYIQADSNYAEIYFDSDTSKLVTITLGMLEEELSSLRFFRINRSIIINVDYLEGVSRKKRLAFLKKNEKEYSFKIPILKIRALEKFLE